MTICAGGARLRKLVAMPLCAVGWEAGWAVGWGRVLGGPSALGGLRAPSSPKGFGAAYRRVRLSTRHAERLKIGCETATSRRMRRDPGRGRELRRPAVGVRDQSTLGSFLRRASFS